MTEHRSQRLGAFLRTHRERLSPEAGGLAAQRRRRTPGLRREEVALLAGISVTWLTRLEQGREVQASAAALARLARVLELSRAERAYLFELAGRRDPDELPPVAEAPPASLMDSIDLVTVPAYLLDPAWTAIGWNAEAAALFGDWFGGTEKNLLRYVFLDPSARAFIADWEHRSARLVAEFRIDYERRRRLAAVTELAEALVAGSNEFRRLWEGQDVLGREGGLRVFNHQTRGRLTFEQLTFIPATEPEMKLVMLLPRRA
jgi:transcriptional regulator with XRE-family HTH domain